MPGILQNNNWKQIRIEAVVLVFLALIITLISDIEYSTIEEHNVLNFVKDLDYRLVTGGYHLLFLSLLYFLFLKRFVFEKKNWAVIVTIVVSAILQRFYSKYVVDGTVAVLPFIDADIRKRAQINFSRPEIYFAFSYFLARDILPLLGLAFFMRSLKQDQQMQELKEKQLVSELNYLKAQMHPHFFFNTINNIYSLALNKSDKTAAMIAKLGEMMRYILYEANQENVLLAREIRFLSDYVDVERMRHRDDMNITVDVQGIEPYYRIEPLLMLPFIENAFKHGIEQELEAGYVKIVICQTENEIMLSVINSIPTKTNEVFASRGLKSVNTNKRSDGSGYVMQSQNTNTTDDKNETHIDNGGGGPANGGIGLVNVLQRLNMLYPGKHSVRFEQKHRHFEAHLTINTK
jgi:sensor histidine kinase YesM